MADVTISGLPNEAASATVDGDVDWMEIDDVSAVETKKVHPRALLIGLTGASVGAVGKNILTQGGLGGPGDGGTPGGTGGDGIVDAGPGGSDGGAGAGTAGVVSIGETNADSITSGSGSTTWTHDGLLRAAIGAIGTPGHSFGTATGVGLRVPAANQLGLVANNEEVVVDNTGATPALRPDVDNVWDCGTATKAWAVVAAYTMQVLTRILAPTGSVGTPSVDIGGRGGLYSPASNQVGLAANGEGVIVDNDSATPSFRPDVDATWDLGEDGIGWQNIFVDSWAAPGTAGQQAITATTAPDVWTFLGQFGGAPEAMMALHFGLEDDADVGCTVQCKVDQAAAEGYTGLLVKVTETNLGSGTKNLMQVLAGAAGSTERMRLNNAGALVLPAAGAVGAPSVIVGSGVEGIFQAATDQLGLGANSEAVIVDNDDTVPSLRPDVDDTWNLGEASFRWADVQSVAAKIATSLDVPAGAGFKIGAVALTTANFTAPNVDKLLDGSDVGALHTHAGLSVPDEANATGDTTTTSATDVALGSMTVTPGAGNYMVHFSTSGNVTASGIMTLSLYVGGVQVAETERNHQGANEGAPGFSKYITGVTGGQAVEVRWRTTGGTATAHERTLTVLAWT